MKGKAGSKGESRPDSPASSGSGRIDLSQFGVWTPSPMNSVHRRVCPACSVGGFFQAESMSKEMKFKLEMKRRDN